MYERYKNCSDLRAQEKCFRVQQYQRGEVVEMFHEHVPAHRISLDSEIETLRALVGQYAGWGGYFIVHSRLNSRRGGPSAYPGFISRVTYPEEGVIRRYFSWGDTTAWADSVFSKGEFRRGK